MRKDGTQALSYIPGKGNSSLPVSTPDLNPNLVRIYIDAQHDYLEDRVYLLGALVVACKDGTPVGRKAVVRMTDGPPDTVAKERQLFVDWTRDLVQAVVDLAVSGAPAGEKKSAPIHVIFFDRYEQRLMLEALARNFPPILKNTPPLYDFLTQIAAFDSPIASYLDEEMRTFKNFPMTCQSLQSVAAYLKFDWNTPHKFRELFKARMFDYLGKLDIDGTSEWFTRRSRFSSSVPLEYAYAAWGQLPTPEAGKGDEFADFRGVTKDLLTAFQVRRLEALEHVANSIHGNPNTQKTPFVLPDLAHYEDKADDLAHALHEFVTIERLVTLNDWKATRHAPPERRVLMGETACWSATSRPTRSRAWPSRTGRTSGGDRKREEYAAAFRAAEPRQAVPAEQGAVRRVQVVAGRPAAAAAAGDGRRRLRPARSAAHVQPAGRRPAGAVPPLDRGRAAAGGRAEGVHADAEADALRPAGRTGRHRGDREGRCGPGQGGLCRGRVEGVLWRRLVTSRFVFPAISRTLEDGKLYTLDPCPNDWYGYWCSQVVEGLCDGQPNVLYDRLVKPPPPGDGAGSPGQAKFLAGLDAFHQAGLLHDFEVGKREFIGGHGQTPVLLVQGPPGTGKSLLHRLRRLRPAPGGDAGESDRTGSSCPARPTPPPTCCSRTCWKCRRSCGNSGTPTRSCSPSISTPGCSTCRCTGWPRTTRRLLASSICSRTPRRTRTRTTTPT